MAGSTEDIKQRLLSGSDDELGDELPPIAPLGASSGGRRSRCVPPSPNARQAPAAVASPAHPPPVFRQFHRCIYPLPLRSVVKSQVRRRRTSLGMPMTGDASFAERMTVRTSADAVPIQAISSTARGADAGFGVFLRRFMRLFKLGFPGCCHRRVRRPASSRVYVFVSNCGSRDSCVHDRRCGCCF